MTSLTLRLLKRDLESALNSSGYRHRLYMALAKTRLPASN